MNHFLAANGMPFKDLDAAIYKAQCMSDESGDAFKVIDIEGGFAVVPVSDPPASTAIVDTADSGTVQPFVHTLRPAWRAQVSAFFLLLIGLVLAIAPAWPIAVVSIDAVYVLNDSYPGIWDNISLVGVIFCVLGVTLAVVKRYWQKSVITNQGVTQSVGIFIFNKISQIEMANVYVVDAKRRNLLHMLLNLGTVELSTPGSGGADVAIVDVASPNKLADFIRYHVKMSKSA